MCKTYSFLRAFLAENRRFEGPEPGSGSREQSMRDSMRDALMSAAESGNPVTIGAALNDAAQFGDPAPRSDGATDYGELQPVADALLDKRAHVVASAMSELRQLRAEQNFERVAAGVARGTPCPYFACKSVPNKDTLHYIIKQYIIRKLWIYSVLFTALYANCCRPSTMGSRRRPPSSASRSRSTWGAC